jgi:hypothetical protein
MKSVIPDTDYDRSKQPENVEYFSSMDSMITNHTRRTGAIKGAFKKKNFLFYQKN